MPDLFKNERGRLVDEPSDSEKAYFRSGVVFIMLYGSLTLYALYCSYVRMPLFSSTEGKKKIIHACIVVQGICETLYGTAFVTSKK